MIRSRFLSWLSRWLPHGTHRLRVLRLHAIERRLRRIYDANREPVATRLHGFPAILNGGNPYPFFAAAFYDFNRALVELVQIVAGDSAHRVRVADVGASLGNTVLLLQERVGASISEIHCVEADEEFFPLLEANTARFPNVHLHRAILARAIGEASALVHHHPGTASAAGAQKVPATTIDSLLIPAAPRFDVLKIDIDGSDGEALLGAHDLLLRDQPAVIFEWHPSLIRSLGNDPRAAFDALRDAGYRRLLWFRNTGPFSHFGSVGDPEIPLWETFLLRMQPHSDPHFDIVALPPRLEHLAFSLASMGQLSDPASHA